MVIVVVMPIDCSAQVEEWNQEIESALVKRARLDSDGTHFSPDCSYGDSVIPEGLGIEQQEQVEEDDGGGDVDVTRLVDTEVLPPPSSLPLYGREGNGNGHHGQGDRGNDRTVVLGYQQQVRPNLLPCKCITSVDSNGALAPRPPAAQPILRRPSFYNGQVDTPLNSGSVCDEGGRSPQLLGRAADRFYSPKYALEPAQHRGVSAG